VSAIPGNRGRVTGAFQGETQVRGTFRGRTVTTTVRVTAAQLLSIEVDPGPYTLAIGVTRQFRAYGQYSDGISRELTTQVTWKSTSESRMVISNGVGTQGLALALAVGGLEIEAELAGVKGQSQVTVTDAALVSLRLEPANSTLPNGLRKAFSAIGTFTDGSSPDLTDQVTWSSEDPGTADVSNASGKQGEVTARRPGKTVIKASLHSVEGKTDLTVTTAVLASLRVTPTNSTVSLSQRSQAFTATGTYSDGAIVDVSLPAIWESSVSGVASIAAGGLASLRSTGITDIKATLDGIAATTRLEVVRLLGLDWTRRAGYDRAFAGQFFQGRFYFGLDGGVHSSVDGVLWKPTRLIFTNLSFPVQSMLVAEGRLLVGTSRGELWATPDGENWSLLASLSDFSFAGLSYGNGLYVATGGKGKIYTSPDGVNWTLRNSGTTRNLGSVVFGANTFVTCDDQGAALRSADGVNWVSSSIGFWGIGLTYGNGQFMAVGVPGAATSPDGAVWTRQTVGNASALVKVDYLQGRYVALGNGSRVFFSVDGQNWSSANIADNFSFSQVLFGNGRFIVGGGFRTPYFASTDLVSWLRTGYPSRYSQGPVAYGNGLYIIASTRAESTSVNLELLSSPDGATWTAHPQAQELTVLFFDGTRFIGLGAHGLVGVSDDGINWTYRTVAAMNNLTPRTLAFGKGLYLAGGDTRQMYSSPDLVNWTPVDYGSISDIVDITFGNDLFVAAAGISQTGSAQLLYSSNGTSWSRVQVPGPAFFSAVTFGVGKFVAVSGKNVAATSTDGVNWTIRDHRIPAGVHDILYANGLFVAAGGSGYISTSPDGINWTLAESDTLNGGSLAASNGRFVAAGSSDILTSP